jgi:hypothetical protein
MKSQPKIVSESLRLLPEKVAICGTVAPRGLRHLLLIATTFRFSSPCGRFRPSC